MAQLIAHHVAGPSRSIRDDLRSLLFEDGRSVICSSCSPASGTNCGVGR
jgi:hypothetical protein